MCYCHHNSDSIMNCCLFRNIKDIISCKFTTIKYTNIKYKERNKNINNNFIFCLYYAIINVAITKKSNRTNFYEFIE